MMHRRGMILALAASLAAPRAFAADAPVLILGDSLAYGLGLAFQRAGRAVANIAVSGSGLSDTTLANWPVKARDAAKGGQRDAIILIGMNDGLNVAPDYADRVRAMLTPLREANIRIWWIATPPSTDPRRNAGIAKINAIADREVPALGGTVLKLVTTFDPATRTEDGIHFRQFGYDRLATAVRQATGL
jgi:hypothetical protein